MFSRWDVVFGLGLLVLFMSAYALAPQVFGMVVGGLIAAFGGMRAMR